MRSLSIIDTSRISSNEPLLICQDDSTQEKFSIKITSELHSILAGEKEISPEIAASISTENTGEIAMSQHTPETIAPENSYLSPREIQHRIRSGQSVDEVAKLSGCDREKVERFAHPVLLERSRVTLMALQAHPIRNDGPAESKLSTLINQALLSRGILPDNAQWDAWRAPEGFWIVRLTWMAGKSENQAHWQYSPGSHGGTVIELDDTAKELTNPQFQRSLQSVSGASKRVLGERTTTYDIDDTSDETDTYAESTDNHLELIQPNTSTNLRKKKARTRASIPAWEDVLLGVRSAQS